MSLQGLTTCCQFAFPPNRFGLCGPKDEDITGYASNAVHPDDKLPKLLSQFATLYPYLQTIAQANKLKDPFDPRVVEAYWLGNRFSNSVTVQELYTLATNQLHLPKVWSAKKRSKLHALKSNAFATHAFHIVMLWQGELVEENPLIVQTMNACFIHPATVISVTKDAMQVQYKPLIQKDSFLTFDQLFTITVQKHPQLDISPGDSVAIHWGFVTIQLTPSQSKRLLYFNKQAISLANMIFANTALSSVKVSP